jgi:hypothetical protein
VRQQSPSARSRKPLLYPLSYGGPAGRAAERWFPFEPSIQRDQELARDLSSGFCELYESQVGL